MKRKEKSERAIKSATVFKILEKKKRAIKSAIILKR
jgi:hypothetical protein